MATIDNLNFKVILDDAEFSSRVKRDIEEAKRLNVQLSSLLSVRQRLNAVGASSAADARRAIDLEARRAQAAARTAAAEERVRTAAERTAREHQRAVEAQNRAAAAAERLSREQRRSADEAGRMSRSLSSSGGSLRQLTSLAAQYFSVVGVTRFLGSVIRVTGEFEMQREALRNIVQDARGADALFGRLQKLAVESPYTFSEITSYAKQLSAFSVPLDELYDTTKMLADVSAGLGVDMGRMILAYGQVRSAAFLRGQEVRQFTEAGVPLLQKLAEQFSELEGRAVSTGEVFDKISKRLVPFEMVQKVMRDLTSEGGQFFDMQAVLSETLKGKVMKLKDAYEQMLFAIGEGNRGFFHGIVDTALSAVRNYESLGRKLLEVVAVLGVYKTAVIVAAAANGGLVATLKNLVSLYKHNIYGVLAGAAVAAAAFVYELTQRQSEQLRMQAKASDAISQYNGYIAEETARLETLWGALQRAEKGTAQYDRAKSAVLQNYGEYLSAVDREKVAVGDLAGVYDRLAASVRSSAKERFLDTVLDGLGESQKEGFSKIAEDLNESLDKLKITDAGTRSELSAYVSGLLSPEDLSKKARAYVAAAKRAVTDIDNGMMAGSRPEVIMIEYLRREFEAFGLAAEETRKKIEGTLTKVRKGLAEPEGELLGWQKDVNAALEAAEGEAAAKSGNMVRKSSETLSEYLERLRKSYKELTENIANASPVYQKGEIEEWRKDLDGVRAVARLLKVDLKEAKFGDLTKDSSGRLTDAQRRERDEINATVGTVEKLRDAYERLRDSVPDELLGDAMRALFPDAPAALRDNADYEGQLRALSERLRAIPGEAEAADRILTGLGGDATRALTDALSAAERFAEAVERLASKDLALDGSGVAFQISKAVGDLRTRNAKVDIETAGIKKDFAAARGSELALKALRVKYGEEFWEAYVARGEEALDELAAREKAYNTRKAQEQITQLASKYVKESVGKGKGIDLSDLSQKSLRQIADLRKRLKEALEGVDVGGLGLSEETTKRLEESGLTLDGFGEAVKALLKGDLDKLDDEMKEKLLAGAEAAAKGVGKLAGVLTELGEAGDDANLAEIGENLQNMSNVLSSTLAGLKSGGAAGAIVGFLGGAADIIVGIFTEEARARTAAAKANRDYANSLALLRTEMDEAAYSSVFGESAFSKMTEALSKDRVALSEYKTRLSEFRDDMESLSRVAFVGLNKKGYELLMPDIPGFEDYARMLRENGLSVWGEDGAFNADAARAFLDANYEIDDSLKSQIQHLIDLKERYDEVREAVDGVVESMTGSLAGDIVDAFLDNFKRVGDAVDDLDEAFGNLGETMAKSMLQSFVQDELLREFEPRFRDMFEAYAGGASGAEEVAAETGRLAAEIRAKAEASAEFINRVLSGFDGAGLLGGETSGASGSLSDGIKAVTEDTASLLASYMNAIRADVSHAKAQREAVLELLRSAIPSSSPTLQEYLAGIQANTYATAEAAREMLSEFRGVLAPHREGGSGVKVVAE